MKNCTVLVLFLAMRFGNEALKKTDDTSPRVEPKVIFYQDIDFKGPSYTFADDIQPEKVNTRECHALPEAFQYKVSSVKVLEKFRKVQLYEDPECVLCIATGLTVSGNVSKIQDNYKDHVAGFRLLHYLGGDIP